MTTISTLPTAPSRQDPSTFATRADAWVAAIGQFTTDTNLVVSELNALAADVSNDAVSAQNSAAGASGAAAIAASAAGAAKWVAGTFAIGDVRYSPANGRIYRAKTAHTGSTDPSADSTNWLLVHNHIIWEVVSADTNAANGGGYAVRTNASSWTLTLPSSPSAGDCVFVMDADNNAATYNIVIGRNGSTIMGSAANMNIDVNGACVTLQYVNSSWRLA